MNDHCIHGELDAVCRACCDPLTVDGGGVEWHREQRRRSGLIALVAFALLAGLVAVAWAVR